MSSADEELLEQMREPLGRIESGATDAEQRLGRYADMSEQLKQITETATSPDQSVTVMAGPGGSVQDIKLTDGIKRLRPDQLSATIMVTMRQALAAAAARKQAAVVQEAVGATDVLQRVLKTQEQLFGVPMTVDGPASGAAPSYTPSSGAAPSGAVSSSGGAAPDTAAGTPPLARPNRRRGHSRAGSSRRHPRRTTATCSRGSEGADRERDEHEQRRGVAFGGQERQQGCRRGALRQ